MMSYYIYLMNDGLSRNIVDRKNKQNITQDYKKII